MNRRIYLGAVAGCLLLRCAAVGGCATDRGIGREMISPKQSTACLRAGRSLFSVYRALFSLRA